MEELKLSLVDQKLLPPLQILSCPNCQSVFVENQVCQDCLFRIDVVDAEKEEQFPSGNFWDLKSDYLSSLNWLDAFSVKGFYFHRPQEREYHLALFARFRKLVKQLDRTGQGERDGLRYLELKNILLELAPLESYYEKMVQVELGVKNTFLREKLRSWSEEFFSNSNGFKAIASKVLSKKVLYSIWIMALVNLISLIVFSILT